MIQKNNLSTLPLFLQRQNANWQKKADVWVHKDEPRKLYGKNLVAYKKTLKLTAQQNKILVGSLLGDGYIDFHRSNNLVTTFVLLKLGMPQIMLIIFIKYLNRL